MHASRSHAYCYPGPKWQCSRPTGGACSDLVYVHLFILLGTVWHEQTHRANIARVRCELTDWNIEWDL